MKHHFLCGILLQGRCIIFLSHPTGLYLTTSWQPLNFRHIYLKRSCYLVVLSGILQENRPHQYKLKCHNVYFLILILEKFNQSLLRVQYCAWG